MYAWYHAASFEVMISACDRRGRASGQISASPHLLSQPALAWPGLIRQKPSKRPNASIWPITPGVNLRPRLVAQC